MKRVNITYFMLNTRKNKYKSLFNIVEHNAENIPSSTSDGVLESIIWPFRGYYATALIYPTCNILVRMSSNISFLVLAFLTSINYSKLINNKKK